MFFTAGSKRVHAWTVRRKAAAPDAVAAIHSDCEKGFIRAEIVRFANGDRLGSENGVKEIGLLRVEGRDDRIEGGDNVFFRFNV